MIKTIQFMSKAAAVQVKPKTDTAMISITGPASEAELIHGWTHLKRMEFHDADVVDFEGCLLFDKDMAKDVIQFVENLPDDVEHMIVHCHAGVSRSGAVAKFIAEITGVKFNDQYSSYNRHIYRVLRDVYYGSLYEPGQSAFETQEPSVQSKKPSP